VSPSDHHQRTVDEQRHVRPDADPAEPDHADHGEDEKRECDGIQNFRRSAEELPGRRDRGRGERQQQSQLEPPIAENGENDPGQECDDQLQHLPSSPPPRL
jgi:hypothetical protein